MVLLFDSSECGYVYIYSLFWPLGRLLPFAVVKYNSVVPQAAGAVGPILLGARAVLYQNLQF